MRTPVMDLLDSCKKFVYYLFAKTLAKARKGISKMRVLLLLSFLLVAHSTSNVKPIFLCNEFSFPLNISGIVGIQNCDNHSLVPDITTFDRNGSLVSSDSSQVFPAGFSFTAANNWTYYEVKLVSGHALPYTIKVCHKTACNNATWFCSSQDYPSPCNPYPVNCNSLELNVNPPSC